MHNFCVVCFRVFVLRRMQLKDNKCVDMDLDLRILLQWQQQFKCEMTWQQPRPTSRVKDTLMMPSSTDSDKMCMR